jgi:D-tyrosyl-tRNA(Tyr) deacylase
MRAAVQRVSSARVKVDGAIVGEIGPGLLVLLGITNDDSAQRADWLAEKLVGLRIFEDDEGKMNRSLDEVEGSMLVVSQFTLYGDCRKGRRPSFVDAARPEQAIPLYEAFLRAVQALGVRIATGQFGAMMQVELINEGPVTLIVDAK